jgi:hypothetical protein
MRVRRPVTKSLALLFSVASTTGFAVASTTGCGLFLAFDDGPADASAVISADAGSLPDDDAGTRPDDAGTRPDDAGTLPDDAGTLPDDAGTLPDDAGSLPDDAGTFPDDAGTFPDDAGTLPDDAGSLPDDAGPGEPDPTVVTPIVTGGLRVETFTPLLADACPTCPDVDGDGLNDTFEDRVLTALRPVLMLHPDEPALTDGSTLALVGRVSLSSADPLVVLVTVMIGWSEDYGSCGLTTHHGDSERFAMQLVPAFDPDATALATVDVTALYTAAHEGTLTDSGRTFTGSTLQADITVVDDDGHPRFALFPSLRKHATYGNASLCESASQIPCVKETCTTLLEGVGTVPTIVNAGEEGAERVGPLDDVGFAGDHAWLEQRFCGGLGDGLESGGCSSPVREKLLVDPFAP